MQAPDDFEEYAPFGGEQHTTFMTLKQNFKRVVMSPAEELERQQKRRALLKQISPVVELTSDYLGMSSYYYNATQNKIYEIKNIKLIILEPDADVDARLRELNHLPLKK